MKTIGDLINTTAAEQSAFAEEIKTSAAMLSQVLPVQSEEEEEE